MNQHGPCRPTRDDENVVVQVIENRAANNCFQNNNADKDQLESLTERMRGAIFKATKAVRPDS
jgi:hypothetical protein